MADAVDSKSTTRKGMTVQVRPPAPSCIDSADSSIATATAPAHAAASSGGFTGKVDMFAE